MGAINHNAPIDQIKIGITFETGLVIADGFTQLNIEYAMPPIDDVAPVVRRRGMAPTRHAHELPNDDRPVGILLAKSITRRARGAIRRANIDTDSVSDGG